MTYGLPAAHDCDATCLISAKAAAAILNVDFGSERHFTHHAIHVLADLGLFDRHAIGLEVRFCEDAIRRFAEYGVSPWDLVLRREAKCPFCGAELGIGCGEG